MQQLLLCVWQCCIRGYVVLEVVPAFMSLDDFDGRFLFPHQCRE